MPCVYVFCTTCIDHLLNQCHTPHRVHFLLESIGSYSQLDPSYQSQIVTSEQYVGYTGCLPVLFQYLLVFPYGNPMLNSCKQYDYYAAHWINCAFLIHFTKLLPSLSWILAYNSEPSLPTQKVTPHRELVPRWFGFPVNTFFLEGDHVFC